MPKLAAYPDTFLIEAVGYSTQSKKRAERSGCAVGYQVNQRLSEGLAGEAQQPSNSAIEKLHPGRHRPQGTATGEGRRGRGAQVRQGVEGQSPHVKWLRASLATLSSYFCVAESYLL
jgi:hypothetical protein